MSKGFDMLRDYIENDALCMRRRKCCDFEYELQQEFAAFEAENDELKAKVLWLEVTLIKMADERYGGGDLIERIKAKIAGKTG